MVKPGAYIAVIHAALALTFASCASEPRCEPLRRCSVRTEACQQSVLRHAACLRGEPAPEGLSFPVRVMDRNEYIAQERADAEEQSEERAKMVRGLALFGLVENEDVRKAAESSAVLVGAYYDSDTRSITLLDDGRGYRDHDVLTLVHEMVHALQDAAGQLPHSQRGRRFDQALASDALIEGEATILTDESAAGGYGYAFEELDYSRALASYRRSALASVRSDDDPFTTADMRFPYAFGASYLWSLRRREGPSALAGAYADPPVSTSAVMVRRPGHRPNDLGRSAVPVLSEPGLSGFTLVGTYHLGAFLYRASLGRRDVRIPSYLLPSGERFVADTLSVFSDGDGRVLAIHRLRFDDEVALSGVAEFMAEQESVAWMGIEGRDVWWAEAEGALPAAPSELRWEPAPESDFGFADEAAPARRVRCLHADWPR